MGARDTGGCVEISADCPLIDPEIVDRIVGAYVGGGDCAAEYVSNGLPPRTFPLGLNVEVMSIDALARAWREDAEPGSREHVTPYIYRHPERFVIRMVRNDQDYSDHRWTVDTEEDLTLVRRIYCHFGHDAFSWRDVLTLLETQPHWAEINREVPQREVP